MDPSSFAHRRLSSVERGSLLRDVVARARLVKGEAPRAIVFDLDGTLFDNRPRVSHIFRELAEHWAEKHPSHADRLRGSEPARIVYGIDENLKRLGIEEEELRELGVAFWKERFFVDAYMKYDEPLHGARDFVRACYEAGGSIVYLTGRDLPNMALGTFASLRDHGFPIGVVGTSLVTKPTFEMPDTEFKREVVRELGRVGRVVASFDNEPANVNLFLEAEPSAVGVFVDTQHAPEPPDLDDRAVVIDDFGTGT